jgi:APA family basic amino acid/polyamine antiporter
VSANVTDPAPSRLARRLGVGDAVVIGLGSMIGAGVFSAIGPAARAAGAGLLIGLVIAAVVALCNATSSAQLAVVYPASGGAYVYGRQRLGAFWGYLAGWGFVVGKIASCAAMALTIGAYAAPSWQRPIAVGAIFGLVAQLSRRPQDRRPHAAHRRGCARRTHRGRHRRPLRRPSE